MKPDWRLKLRLLTAQILIKLGKIKHVDFSTAELSQALDQHLPETFAIDVPISKGELTLLEAKISMPRNAQHINLDLFSSLVIGPVGNPIYRAHVNITLEAYPIYEVETNTVKLDKLLVRAVRLINDEYAIIEDSRDLLGVFLPKPLQSILTGTVKSALGLLTAGTSDMAANYIGLYLSGSKQRILDYHRPQIEALVSNFAQQDEMSYQLNEQIFEQQLFCLYGKDVVVEDGRLRFRF